MSRALLILLLSLSALANAQTLEYEVREIEACMASSDSNCEEMLQQHFLHLSDSSNQLSEINSLIRLAKRFTNSGNFNLAIPCTRRALSLAKVANNQTLTAQSHSTLSAIFVYSGSLDSSARHIQIAHQLHIELQDSFKTAVSFLNMGQTQKEQGHYEAALSNYISSLELFQIRKNNLYVAHVENEMASLYAMTDEVNKAIEFGLKAVRIYREEEQRYYEAYALLNLANNLIYSSFEDTALILLSEALPIFKDEGNIYMQMNALAQTGRAHFRLGDSQLALNYFKRSNELDPSENFVLQLAYNQEFMSRIYRQDQSYDKALFHSKRAYVLHQRLGWNEEYEDVLRDLALSFKNVNQPDSALKYYQELVLVSDSLFSINQKRQLNELKSKYENDLKEEKIKSDQLRISLLEDQNRAKSQRNLALLVMIIAISFLAINVILRQRQAIRLSRRLALEKEKSLLAQLTTKREEEKRLKAELDYKKRNLASQALLIAEKNELLLSFKNELNLIDEPSKNSQISRIVNKMDRAENKAQDWDKFMEIFKEVHPHFHKLLLKQFTGLTQNDLRLASLIKMNFTSKEISNILHISDEGLKKARYRFRKKMSLGSDVDLYQYLQAL